EVALAVPAAGELDDGASEVGLRRDEIEVREPGRPRQTLERRSVQEVVARASVRALAEPGGRVRLRVEVDDERPLARLGEAGGEVDRGRRLPDAALLVRERVDRPRHASKAIQARGRFLATPGRRGKPGGVGPSLRRTSRPGGPSTRRAASRSATRETAPASAVGPTYSTAAPPGATRGRHHSAAVTGGARAFATATPYVSVSCSSARPCTTSAFGGAHRRRKSHLRPFASRSVTSRSGSAAASGIPGVPTP